MRNRVLHAILCNDVKNNVLLLTFFIYFNTKVNILIIILRLKHLKLYYKIKTIKGMRYVQ